MSHSNIVRLVGALLALSLHGAAPAPTSATHISHADVMAVLARAPLTTVSDQQIRMVSAGAYNVGVGVVHRPQVATQTSIVHDELAEVYYVLEGAGTLVTGGALVNPQIVPPSSTIYRELTGPSSLGSAIEGGESRRVAAGDVVIIPSGVSHWFSDVQGSIKYLVIRVDPERLLQTK